jgi:Tol biopolymer transport system component
MVLPGGTTRCCILPPTPGRFKVSDRGGDAAPLFPPQAGESDYHTPSTLPDGRGLLFTTHNTEGRDTIELFADGERQVLLHIEGARLEYAAWSALPGSDTEGHLVFHRKNTNVGIWAMPFDLRSRTVTGDPFLLDSAGSFPSVSRDGSLLYSIDSGGGTQQLVFVNRQGEILSRIGRPQVAMRNPRVSPDGKSVLVSVNEGESRDIWLHDVERGTRTRITFSSLSENHPNWLDNGAIITFTRGSVNAKTFVIPTDGSGEPQDFAGGYHLSTVSGSELVAASVFVPITGNDIYYRSSLADTLQPFLQTAANEVGAEISPDGKYITYMSNESGSNEVYMKAFPTGEGKWQVSTSGGAWPRWNRAGDEILFRSGAEATASLMSVSVSTSPRVRLGTPSVLFTAEDAPNISFRSGFPGYDATPDPDVLVMLEFNERESGPAARLVFAENWYKSYRSDHQ